MANLLIIGAGQYGLVAMEIAQAMRGFGEIAFFDDNYSAAEQPAKIPLIMGQTTDIGKFVDNFHYGFVAIGNPDVRRHLIESLQYNRIKPALLVHPSAYVSPSAVLKDGCCIEPNATVQVGAKIGIGSFIASGAVIRHNAKVGDYCQVDCNAVVSSSAKVPSHTKVPCCSVFE